MKKTLSLTIIGLFLSLAMVNGVSAITTEEKDDLIREHSPIYVGLKPLRDYNEPGFVCGFYNEIEWASEGNVRYLFSPNLLFGWDIGIIQPPSFFRYSFQIGAFATRVQFDCFRTTFVGVFTGTEPGFICGYINGNCNFIGPLN